MTNGLGPSGAASAANTRLGAGSPSHELGGRLFSKRAREIQAQERLTPNLWGPPTSGNSTPLRETIPESPTNGFPDLLPLPAETSTTNSARRARAGTVPSRFSPIGLTNGVNVSQTLAPKTSRPTPTGSPFKSNSPANGEASEAMASSTLNPNSALLSRLRSGSMPQRASYVGPAGPSGPSGPFGPTLFSTNWSNGRDRATTLTSLGSTNAPSSPAQSSFSKDGMGDHEMRTLDYLGLADTPQPVRANLAPATLETLLEGQQVAAMQPFMADLVGFNKNLNRFRSYSVNAKEKYAEEEEEEMAHTMYPAQHSGSLTPSASSAAAALAATQAQIHQHNLAVQAFANQASASRPRARTAGVLESPPARSLRNYLATPSRLDNSITAADLRLGDARDFDGLPEAVQALQLAGLGTRTGVENEANLEGPTRALWLGSIPSSTTVTSLNAIFGTYGKIESARVLTHKNCGFINFDRVESAIQAKSLLNGKEIFPGAGPIRIGYAKVPDASTAATPGTNGAFPSPSPDPFSSATGEHGLHRNSSVSRDGPDGHVTTNGAPVESTAAALTVPSLPELRSQLLKMVGEFGASEQDQVVVADSIDQAIQFRDFAPEIPAIPEPSHNRIHDAPKLREIRKRIDNNACSSSEIEEIAMAMLPEIAELASDYLGNTVVQKLFENCSEGVKDMMLQEIAPHLAEIGVHKNGTWAAQKIIDVSKTPTQMSVIVENLRPYTVALFLDQYGNYVLQCVLRFGSPWNNFIFESMLDQMWEIAQGRFGARAMRACLESHHATKDQQRMLAAAIALHSVQLATNTNGALLLTWFLDTCTFPHRRTVLAPRLVPHLAHLCTHKVAYLTVLKVINQRNEPEARDIVLNALFFSPDDPVLEEILSDAGCGATLIFKVLTTPFLEDSMRPRVIQNVRNVLLRIKAQPSQGYKRLMDEVGLSTRNGGGSGRDSRDGRDRSAGRSQSRERPRPGSRQHSAGGHNGGHTGGHTPQPTVERQYSGQYFPAVQQVQYDPQTGLARNSGAGVDPNAAMSAFEQFGLTGVSTPMFTPNPNMPVPAITPQQLQYQQAILAASARSMAPASFYPGAPPTSGLGYAPSTVTASMDSYRPSLNSPHLNASGMAGGQPGFAPPPQAFPMMSGQMNGQALNVAAAAAAAAAAAGAGGAPAFPYPAAAALNGMSYLPQQHMGHPSLQGHHGPQAQQQQQQQQQSGGGGNRR
ncbi:MAG: hypothetical protein M1838_000082 [Thelocarpon superellum]|nr:MAG: hypothetical protein M1838_000082 [Thelocarpon superellum]